MSQIRHGWLKYTIKKGTKVVSFRVRKRRADLNCLDVPNMSAVAGYLLLLTILLLLAFLLLFLVYESWYVCWCFSGSTNYICCCWRPFAYTSPLLLLALLLRFLVRKVWMLLLASLLLLTPLAIAIGFPAFIDCPLLLVCLLLLASLSVNKSPYCC